MSAWARADDIRRRLRSDMVRTFEVYGYHYSDAMLEELLDQAMASVEDLLAEMESGS